MSMKLVGKNTLAVAIILSLVSAGGLAACAMKQQQETVGQYVDGGILTAQVKSKILADKELNNTSIAVKTYQSQVQLSGFVNTQAQKVHAERVARSVEGVNSVDNALLIKK
jgi:hyperosmotically inducible periplasmic protein